MKVFIFRVGDEQISATFAVKGESINDALEFLKNDLRELQEDKGALYILSKHDRYENMYFKIDTNRINSYCLVGQYDLVEKEQVQ